MFDLEEWVSSVATDEEMGQRETVQSVQVL